MEQGRGSLFHRLVSIKVEEFLDLLDQLGCQVRDVGQGDDQGHFYCPLDTVVVTIINYVTASLDGEIHDLLRTHKDAPFLSTGTVVYV